MWHSVMSCDCVTSRHVTWQVLQELQDGSHVQLGACDRRGAARRGACRPCRWHATSQSYLHACSTMFRASPEQSVAYVVWRLVEWLQTDLTHSVNDWSIVSTHRQTSWQTRSSLGFVVEQEARDTLDRHTTNYSATITPWPLRGLNCSVVQLNADAWWAWRSESTAPSVPYDWRKRWDCMQVHARSAKATTAVWSGKREKKTQRRRLNQDIERKDDKLSIVCPALRLSWDYFV